MMIKNIFSITLLLVSVHSAKLPSSFQKCKVKDQECLKRAIQDAIPKFSKGFKSLGVPGIDPLDMPRMEIPGGSGAVKISQKVSNGKLYGLSEAFISESQFNVDSGKIHWIFHIPNITLEANYEMSGQILVLPVNGKGRMKINIANAKMDEKIKVIRYSKDNKDYLKIDDTSLEMDAEHVYFNLDNLFEGNKELSDQINVVMNDNWSAVFDELKGGYNNGIRKYMDNIVNTFFSKIPMEEIFLD